MENKNLTSFSDHLNLQYGIRGTETRDKYEKGFESFKMGAMIHELHKAEKTEE